MAIVAKCACQPVRLSRLPVPTRSRDVNLERAVDPLYRLEHEQADKRRAASRKTALTRLTELSDLHGRDDYSANAALRQGMRSRKKKDKERDDEARVCAWHYFICYTRTEHRELPVTHLMYALSWRMLNETGWYAIFVLRENAVATECSVGHSF